MDFRTYVHMYAEHLDEPPGSRSSYLCKCLVFLKIVIKTSRGPRGVGTAK